MRLNDIQRQIDRVIRERDKKKCDSMKCKECGHTFKLTGAAANPKCPRCGSKYLKVNCPVEVPHHSPQELEAVGDEPEPEEDELVEPEPLWHGGRDFRNVATRRVDGALAEIANLVKILQDEIAEHRDAGDWDLLPEQLEQRDYVVSQIKAMVGRIEAPKY